MTHQELLDGYIKARLSVIHEFSGQWIEDVTALAAEVEEYVHEYNARSATALLRGDALNTVCLDDARSDIAHWHHATTPIDP